MHQIKKNNSTPEKFVAIKRNELKKPLLLIYPVYDKENKLSPLYIFFLKLTMEKVKYIFRNKTQDQL